MIVPFTQKSKNVREISRTIKTAEKKTHNVYSNNGDVNITFVSESF